MPFGFLLLSEHDGPVVGHLVDDGNLKYCFLWEFDRDMIHLLSERRMLSGSLIPILCDEEKKVLAFMRKNCIFALNFNVKESFSDYRFEAPAGSYRMVLDSDSPRYGGFGRNDSSVVHYTIRESGRDFLSLYLPCRSAMVLEKF